MDADLEFNFAIAPNAVAKPATKSSGGKWTARVGRMQKNKRKSGVAAKPVPAVPAVSAAPPTEEVPIEAAEPVVKAVRRTVISSLFTSLPAIEPQPSTSDVTLEDLAPSNAPSSADFGSLGILPELRRSLQGAKFGLERPTVVQRIAIPKLLRGTSDTILQAQTGSGKTIAYLLPIIQDLIQLGRKADNALDRTVGTLAIVLVPTRELAQQVYQVALSLLDSAGSTAEGAKTQSKDHLWLVPGVLSGGTTRQHEKARLRKGVPLLIATPGRLIDHLEGTLAFKLGGENARKKPRHTKPKEDANEFSVEDSPFVADTSTQDAHYISSDEDFSTQARSRSYRSRPLKKLESLLSFRWLVLDEADRLMDMGFEPQVRKIIDQLDQRAKGAKRRSVLCSATMQGNVEKLAGYALNEPELIKHEEDENVKTFVQHAPPSQLAQNYIVVPEKLRFVSLISLLRQQLKAGGKTIVFVSSTSSVDFHWHALAGLQMGRNETAPVVAPATEDLVASCVLFPRSLMYRLHGNLDLPTRLNTLRQYTACKESAVLFCTSVASRGLDIPGIKTVIQFDLPTEGGAMEYVHRVGRTARAGQQGEAWAFLLPSETGYVKWVSGKMSEGEEVKNRLKEVPVEDLLRKGFGGDDYETRSTDVQMGLERWVDREENTALARTAFASQIRAYATHPNVEKAIFHVKNIHLGHLAKSFGLREAPTGLGKLVGKAKDASPAKGAKRPREEDPGTDSEVEEIKRVKQPRTGRALEGKGLRPATGNSRNEFNIA